MRALANFVMRGRAQAVLVAVLATGSVFFAWVGAAVVALVTLRKGGIQGSQVLFWAMIPALFLAAKGDTGPVTSLLGVMLVALVLRSTASWSWALLAATLSGLATTVVMATVGQGYVEEILRLLTETLAQLASQPDSSVKLEAAIPTAYTVAGLLGLSNAFIVVISVMLARWWQAVLYNPGGFGTEFRAFKLPPQLTVLLLVAGLGLSALDADFRVWAIIVTLPLMFAGIALVHGLVNKRQLSNNWLVVFYFSVVLLDLAKVLLLIVAIVDSWVNIRERVASR